MHQSPTGVGRRGTRGLRCVAASLAVLYGRRHFLRHLLANPSSLRSNEIAFDANPDVSITERYDRRESCALRYSPLNASVYMAEQEKERALIRWIKQCQIAPV